MRIIKGVGGAAILALGLASSPAAHAVAIYTPAFSVSSGAGSETYFADTGLQTTDFLAQFNIPQFNPGLGTLTSLSVSVGGSMSALGTITNNGAGTATGVTISQNSTITNNPPQVVTGSFGGVSVLTGSPNGDTFLLFTTAASAGALVGSLIPTATVSNISLSSAFATQTLSQTSSFDPNLIGNGTFGISFATGEYTTSGGSGGNLAQSATTQDAITLSITYNFSETPPPPPTVPEPASMTLIGSGLLGIAAVARRRRKI